VDAIKRLKKRVEAGDAGAIYELGLYYSRGLMGLPEDDDKAMELWLQAGELGYATAYGMIGYSYDNGKGVKRDWKKAKYYYGLAAVRGDTNARHNFGCLEMDGGNMNRAVKHFMIAAGAGEDDSLKAIRDCFMHGHATKHDFERALRAHKEAKDDMKSDQRDAAAALFGFNDSIFG
jgi:TPR repeat protein